MIGEAGGCYAPIAAGDVSSSEGLHGNNYTSNDKIVNLDRQVLAAQSPGWEITR
ncbi:MAG: hypothetical protein ACREF3_00250 [Acetobacteraceae bacterium]